MSNQPKLMLHYSFKFLEDHQKFPALYIKIRAQKFDSCYHAVFFMSTYLYRILKSTYLGLKKIINKDPPTTKKMKVCIDKKSISCHARIFSPNRLISEVWNNKLLHYFLSICKLNKKRTNKNLSRLIKETIQRK